MNKIQKLLLKLSGYKEPECTMMKLIQGKHKLYKTTLVYHNPVVLLTKNEAELLARELSYTTPSDDLYNARDITVVKEITTGCTIFGMPIIVVDDETIGSLLQK